MTEGVHQRQCELCPKTYWVNFLSALDWDGVTPCSCGEPHHVCLNCAVRLDLLDDGEWGKGTVPFKTCPFSDEFQVGLALLGDGAVVEPRPRGER